MNSLLFALPVKRPRHLLWTMGLLSCLPAADVLAQGSRAGQIQTPAYGAPAYQMPPAYQPQGPQQPMYQQPTGNPYGQPGYRPPQPTAPQQGRTTAARKPAPTPMPPADPGSYHKLANKVAELSSNDKKQDQRLRTLERKPGVRTPSGDGPGTVGTVPYVKYTVRPGDSLWRIAAKHKVSINDVRAFNRMPNDTIAVNQVLMIPDPKGSVSPSKLDYPKSSGSSVAYDYGLPASSKRGPGATHVVRPGESLGAIAKSYGIPTATLANANRLKNPNDLQVGQKLTVPVAGSGSNSNSTRVIAKTSSSKPKTFVSPREPDMMPMPGHGLSNTPSPAYPSQPAPAPAPLAASTAKTTEPSHRGVLAYRVVRGDDVNTIANLFGTTPQKIREINKLGATADVKEGEEIVVPSMSAVSVN